MTDDLFNEFMGCDFAMGADVMKCPQCGVDVPRSLFFDNKNKVVHLITENSKITVPEIAED